MPSAESSPVVYGKYQLLELLARGGMAEVFKAKSHGVEGFEKILVIKRILPELAAHPGFVDMFIAEAKIAVTLSHANVVQVFDLGRATELDGDSYFIAMEYVAGFDFATVLRRGRQLRRPVSQELAVFVVSELAKGLDYAHRRRDASLRPLGIVHRDVSPQNVLLSFEGEVKLTDFGIAKARTIVKPDTDAGVLKGKYAYMSPEQARGEAVDARTDLYALGVVLYEALAGVNPFQADTNHETLRRVREGAVPQLKSVARAVPDELAAIVDRALSRNPDDRHPNAGRMYEDLVQFLYSSGRRVGGHDLSRYLLELRQASDAASSDQDGDRLLAMFEADADPSRVRTPVEVPLRSRPPPATKTKTATGVTRPTTERREVTMLVVRTNAGVLLRDPTIDRMLRRFGGTPLASADAPNGVTEATLGFGLRDPDGRDTESAARAALRLLRAVHTSTHAGREVALQIGVHAGRILVDLAGEAIRDEAFEGLRRGARDLAARAHAGQALLSPEAQQSIAGLFAATRLGPDGAPYSLDGEIDQGDAAGKFVGRRDELRQMGELLALANRGRARVVSVVGDAGAGKSRLLTETRRRLRLGGHDVGMTIATLSRQSRSVPLSSVQELLRAIVGIDEFDPEETIRDRVARLRELGLAPQELGALAAALGAAPFPEATESLGRLLRPALSRMATKLAADRLTVLCFDGAESMDDESQAIVDGVLKDVASARVAVVLAYRPGFTNAWRQLPNHHELGLGAMSDDDVARLAATRLSAEEVPLELLREITTKSAGNPLYVEEYLKALTDAGAVVVTDGRVAYHPEVAEVEVPKNLRGIVSARLARLSPTDRHLMQIAAVAGGRCSVELLAEVSGEGVASVRDAVDGLEQRGVIQRLTSGDVAFAHEMVGDVLRDGLTIDSRREIHRAVAVGMERLFPQKLDDLAERLAAHFREAGDREKAVDYLVRAAVRLQSEHALVQAVTALERAIELLSQMAVVDREKLLGLYLRLTEILWKARQVEQGLARLVPATELAEGIGADVYVARFSLLRGRFLCQAYKVDEGREWLARSFEIASRLADPALTLDVVLARSEADVRIGERKSAIEHLEHALGLAVQAGNVEAQMRALVNLALTHATAGQSERGLARVGEARDLVAQHPDRYTECEIEKMESLVHFFASEYADAIEAAQRGLELAKEYGFPYEQAVNAHNMGEGYVRLGDYKRAFASLRYSYEIARDHGIEHLQVANMRVLGFIDAMRFGSEEGRNHVLDAIRHAEQRRAIWDMVQGRYLLAMIDQQRGNVEDARAGLREALRLASEHGYDAYAASCDDGLRAIEEGKPIPLMA